MPWLNYGSQTEHNNTMDVKAWRYRYQWQPILTDVMWGKAGAFPDHMNKNFEWTSEH